MSQPCGAPDLCCVCAKAGICHWRECDRHVPRHCVKHETAAAGCPWCWVLNQRLT